MAKKKTFKKKTALKKPTLSVKQKRHKAIMRGISNYNKRQKKGGRLDRKQFWEAYHVAKIENTKKPVRGLIGKISKDNWRNRIGAGKVVLVDTTTRARMFPPDLGDDYLWFDIIKEIDIRGQNYFEPMDLIILRFEDATTGSPYNIFPVNSFEFTYGELLNKTEPVVYADLKAQGDFGEIVKGTYSPQSMFLYNPIDSNPFAGIFFFDLTLGALNTSGLQTFNTAPKKITARKKTTAQLDAEIKKYQEEIKKLEAQKKRKKK